MKTKILMVVFLAIALMLATPNLASAQYSDSISDPTGDIDHYRWTETGYSIQEDVDRPNIDIVSISTEESGGNLTIEMEVQGTVQSDDQSESHMWYVISLEDENGDTYDLTYYFGQLYIDWPQGIEYGFTEPTGFGTSTLQIDFSLDAINNPDSLEITDAITYEYTASEGTGEYYTDTAEPAEDGAPPGDNGDTNTGEEDYTEFVDDLMERGMMCLLIAIIIPIIIVVIVIIVIIKIVKKDDKGGEQPPRQEYQQPPPPARSSQEPEMQYQGAPPPEETGGEISPGEDIMEEEEF